MMRLSKDGLTNVNMWERVKLRYPFCVCAGDVMYIAITVVIAILSIIRATRIVVMLLVS